MYLRETPPKYIILRRGDPKTDASWCKASAGTARFEARLGEVKAWARSSSNIPQGRTISHFNRI